jgi:hypothetical protein
MYNEKIAPPGPWMKFHLFLGKLTFIGYKIMFLQSLATSADTQDGPASLNTPFDSCFPILANLIFPKDHRKKGCTIKDNRTASKFRV